MPNRYLSTAALSLLAITASAAQRPAQKANTPAAPALLARPVAGKPVHKDAAVTIDLPEAHNGQVYLTRLLGAGAFHLPVTCKPDGKMPKWLTFDCNNQQFYGTAVEPADVQYTFTLTMQGSDGDQPISYVMQLPVRFGADIAVVHGAAPKLPAAPLPGPAPLPALAPAPLPSPVAFKTTIDTTTQVVEGAQTISGIVGGLPPGAPALSMEAFIQPHVPGTLPRPSIELTSVPAAGTTSITGYIHPMPVPAVPADPTTTPPLAGNYPEIVVWLHDANGQRHDFYEATLETSATATSTHVPVAKDGSFSLLLKYPLVAGQEVEVEVVPPSGRSFEPPPPGERRWQHATVVQREVKSTLAVSQPSIGSALVEGATVISGTATPSGTASGTINVAILQIDESQERDRSNVYECLPADRLQAPRHTKFLLFSPSAGASSNTTPVSSTGTFSATLARSLAEGDRIRVVQVLPAGTVLLPGEQAKCSSEAAAVTYKFDWFRTNVTFMAGVLLSNSSTNGQSSANFSQANQFYALNVDRSWRLPGADCVDGIPFGSEDKSTSPGIAPTCIDKRRNPTVANRWKASRVPGFSTYFETRLTSIPVSSTTTTTNTLANTPAPSPTATASATASGSTGTPTTTPAFLTSQKTIRVSTGAYLPWVIGHSDGHHPNAIFFAPIAKVGFDTIAGSAQQSTVILPSGNVGTLNYESAYNFFSFGGRVGHMALSSSRSRAPLIDDYLDVTIGRFSNLGSFICHAVPHTGTSTAPGTGAFTNTSCLANYPGLYYSNGNSSGVAIADVSDSLKRLYRVDLEGLIKIPLPTSFPLYVGFNANIAQHTVGAARLDHAYAPPDDIRIFFGTKFDIGSFLTKFNLGAN